MESLIHPKPLFLAAPVHWYADLVDGGELVILNESRFIERSFRNRLEFTGVSGRQSFSIPLVKDSKKKDYKSVELAYQEHWQNRLVNALRTSYGKAPFFEYYDYRFEPILKHKFKYLWELNFELLKTSLACLKLDLTIRIEDGDALDEANEGVESLPYYQVFADKNDFHAGLSVLDLIYNEGSSAFAVLHAMKNKSQIIR